jgi:exodeoxyribonuclease V gamma subunit
VLRVYYSNRTEELLDALVERVRRVRGSLYDPVHIVVPNRNLQTYLELSLARLEGICANVRFHLLHELVARRTLAARVLRAMFDDELLSHPELEPVRTYLEAGGRERRAVDRRRVQLARELGRLYAAYADTRPELIECWRAGLFSLEPELRSLETWQRRLWLELGDEGLELSDELPPVVQVFGVSYLPRAQIELLGRAASDVYLYTLNPCQEIWEAISAPVPITIPITRSPRRYERRGKKLGPGEMFSIDDPFRLANAGEMLPLRLWGRVSRENLRLTNALTGCELVPRIKGREPSSLLEQLQRDIALRKPERKSIPDEFRFDGDESIVVLESASVRRELEAIASEIWRVIQQSESDATAEPLRFNEIAVILAPSVAKRYQALIGSVFGQMHALPLNIVDLPARGESPIAEAIEMLLEIPPSRFTRKDILRFVTHPSVIASFPEGSRGDCVAWCDALGIVRGVDRKDQDDTYIQKDVFNWDQGLKRLALGTFMSVERAGDERLFRQGDDTYLVEEIPYDKLETAGRFGLFVRSLLSDARDAARVQMTVSGWMDFMSAFITTYVEPHSPEDERVLRRCLRAIGTLAETDLGGRKIGYDAAHELVSTELRGLSGGRGQYLVDGIVVSSFLPMRSIPFKVVFLAGLGEGHFPAPVRRNYLDLRRAQHRPGDVSPREQDTCLFLETLLCTRQRLYLSYVARDELTGEPLQPSSVVLELIETLERGFVKEVSRKRFPLRRFDDAAARRCSPAALREACARDLGESLRTHLGRAHLAGARLEELPDDVRKTLRCVTAPLRHEGAQRGEAEAVPLSAIRRFLECPLQGSARFALRLTENEDRDLLSREDEMFRAEPLESALLLRETFRRGGTPAVYDERAHRLELVGDRPTGVFGASERERHLDTLASWRRAVSEVAGGEVKLAPRPPATCLIDEVRLELGPSPLLFSSSPRLAIRLCAQSRSRFDPRRESLHGFVDHVFQSAAGVVIGEPYALVVINAASRELPDEPVIERFTFAPIPRDKAVRYLAELLDEMRQGVHDYALPCEVALSNLEPQPPEKTSSRFGPVRHPEDYDAPEPSRVRAIVERRFGLYFESLGESR